MDLDVVQLQTAQDFKDACKEELKNFKFANRETGKTCEIEIKYC